MSCPQISLNFRPALKNYSFPVTGIARKKVTRVGGETFFDLFSLNITFYFKCYFHHNCSVNLNWNNTRLYSSAKPLPNVPSSLFWFVNFCFLPFLCRTRVQKWKKMWFYYAHKWICKKEILADILKCPCWNLFIRVTTQIRAVYKDLKICITLKRWIALYFKFLDSQHKISILWLLYLQKYFLLIWWQCK